MKQNYVFSKLQSSVNSQLKSIAVMLLLGVATFGYGQTVTLGTGTDLSTAQATGAGLGPVNQYYANMHYQVVYTAAELIASGAPAGGGFITSFGWNVSSAPPNPLANYTVRMAHTTATNSAAHDATATTTVYGPTNTTFVPGFNMFTLTGAGFNWNGTSNILVDICSGASLFDNPYGRVFVYNSGTANGSRFSRSDTANQCTVTTNLVNTFKPQARFVFPAVTPCAGTPLGGTVAVSPTSGSPGSTYGVTASSYTSGTGLTYQWQYSDTAGPTWTNQGTATASYAALTGLTAPAFGVVRTWQLVVRCTASAISTSSTTATFTSSYCTPTGTTSYWITNFSTTGGLTNIANTTGNSNIYGNYSAISASQYAGSAINLSIATSSGTHYFYGWVDWNNDGDFVDAGEAIFTNTTFNANYTGNYTIPAAQPAGSYRMRIANSWSATAINSCSAAGYSEYEDYTLIVQPLPACSGTPAAGSIVVSPASGNAGATYGITASGYTIATGLSFQWQYSDTNGPTWTNVGTATSTYAALTGETAPAFGTIRTWRLAITCTNSGETGYSTTGTFTSVLTYCTPVSNNIADYISNFVTTGGITDINNPSGNLSGTGYGDFYAAYSASQLAGGTLNFTETYNGGNHGFNIWVDLNKNGTFEATERLFIGASTAAHNGTITIPGTTAPGDYRMRIRAWRNNANPDPCTNIPFGEAEDYKLTVISATPCAEPTAQATNLVLTVSGTTINGTFTAATPAPNSYLVVYNTTGTTPNPLDSTTYTIGGTVGAGNTVADTDGNTTFSVSGLNAITTYYFYVFSYNNSACLPTYLNPTPLTNTATTGVSYCVPAITSTVEPITLVNFAGINNTSAATTGPPAYQDFTATSPASVTQGLDYTITVKGNTNGGFTNYFTAFIDWNQNGYFTDPGEIFPIGSVNNSTGLDAKQASLLINIPNTALPGSTRMRVIKNFNTSPTDPCGPYTFGQTEDYTVNVSTPLPPTITSIPSDACGGSSIVITGTSLNFATSVTVGGIAATITNNTATSITVTLGAGATGVVEVTTSVGTATSPTTITVTAPPNLNRITLKSDPTTTPYCNSVEISYTSSGATPPGVQYFWQTVDNGTSTLNNSPTYSFNTIGFNIIYLRAYNTITGCWSIVSKSINRTVLSPDAAITDPIPANGATGICFAGLGATPSLNWANLGVGYTYEVYFGTASNPPFVGTRSTNSFPIATGLLAPNTTYYWYIVPVSACGPSTVTPTIYSFTTNNAACYCTPSISGNNPGRTYISQVSFLGTLNDMTNNSTFSAAPNGYQDFTGLPNRSQQAQGEGMNVYFRATNPSLVKAWVDWNRDGDFTDTGELVYTAFLPAPGTVASSGTIGINILPNRTVGFYRLRIRVDEDSFGSYNFGPCDNINYYGETEDYLFEVVRNCEARITTITDGEACGLPLGGNVDVPLSVGVTLNSTEVRWYSALTGGSLLHTSTVSGTTSTWTPSIGTTTTYYVTAYEDDNCESLVRTPIVAKVKPVANITYTPTNPESCGEDSIVTLTANGDNELVNLIDEGFNTNTNGGLGVFIAQNVNGGPNYGLAGWKRRTSTFIPNEQSWRPAISSGFGTNKFAMATSDVGDGNYDNALMSPITSTMTFLDLNLTFRMYYSDYSTLANSDQVTLEISTNGGTAWTVINTYNSSVGIGTKFELQTYNLSAYINEPNFRFRIRYTSPWTDGVAIDDIKLSGTKPLTPSFSWTGVPAVAAFTDFAATIPYITGTTATTVYIKPTLAQLELGTYNFTATATLSNGCTTSQDITITNKSKVWKGSPGNQDWDNANNWLPNGVPTADNCVIIPTDVKIPNNGIPIPPVGYLAVAKNLTIKSGGSLELLSGNNLTVTDWIHNEGTNNFDIRNDASLLQVNNDINIGAMKMDRTLLVKKTDYTYYSSPVEGNNINTLSPGTPASVTLKWLPTTNAGGGFVYGNWTSPGSEIMAPGKGYIVRGPSGYNATPQTFNARFDGVPRNGTITVPITRGNYTGGNLLDQGRVVTRDDDNYNLIGNPYPSAIGASAFLNNTQNSNILGTIWLWPHGGIVSAANPDPFYENYVYNYNSNDYITWNAVGSVPSATFSGYIGAGQSFFVLMTDVNSVSENVYFNNTMRVTDNNTQFLRSSEVAQENEMDIDVPEPQRIYLDLVKPDGKTNSILVGYLEGATYESDRLFDSPVLDNATQLLYSRIGEENMIIQGRPMPLDENDQVPLGVLIPQQGIYTVAINSVDGIFLDPTQNIYLEDFVTGMIHNLKNAPYTFSAETGRYDNRFVLRYNDDNTLNTPEIITDSDLKITGLKEYIKVTSGNSPIKTITVFDAAGRSILDYKDVKTMEFKIPLDKVSEGTLVVKVTLENGKQKTKKVVH